MDLQLKTSEEQLIKGCQRKNRTSQKMLFERFAPGGGVSWYNFKFQNDNTRLTEEQEGLIFYEDTESGFRYQKSKLTVSYANLYLVPVYQFGRNKYKPDGNSGTANAIMRTLAFVLALVDI